MKLDELKHFKDLSTAEQDALTEKFDQIIIKQAGEMIKRTIPDLKRWLKVDEPFKWKVEVARVGAIDGDRYHQVFKVSATDFLFAGIMNRFQSSYEMIEMAHDSIRPNLEIKLLDSIGIEHSQMHVKVLHFGYKNPQWLFKLHSKTSKLPAWEKFVGTGLKFNFLFEVSVRLNRLSTVRAIHQFKLNG